MRDRSQCGAQTKKRPGGEGRGNPGKSGTVLNVKSRESDALEKNHQNQSRQAALGTLDSHQTSRPLAPPGRRYVGRRAVPAKVTANSCYHRGGTDTARRPPFFGLLVCN